MKVKTIEVDGVAIELRLTASRLAAFAEKTKSGGNTLFSIMDALDDVSKQGHLLTAALTFKGNTNSIRDGFDLIDALADAAYTPIRVKELIVSLAVDSGIIDTADAEKLTDAIKAGSEKLYNAAAAVLSGNAAELSAGNAGAETQEKNPT